MKVTKEQLKEIIKEERAKLLEQASGLTGAQRRTIDDLRYQFEDEINSRMGSEDRNWYKNEDVILAVLEMLDGLKETIQEYGKM